MAGVFQVHVNFPLKHSDQSQGQNSRLKEYFICCWGEAPLSADCGVFRGSHFVATMKMPKPESHLELWWMLDAFLYKSFKINNNTWYKQKNCLAGKKTAKWKPQPQKKEGKNPTVCRVFSSFWQILGRQDLWRFRGFLSDVFCWDIIGFSAIPAIGLSSEPFNPECICSIIKSLFPDSFFGLKIPRVRHIAIF